MKRINSLRLLSALMLLVGVVFCSPNLYAEEGSEEQESASKNMGASISITPVSKVLQISSGSTYDAAFTVNNLGDSDMKIEVYAAPYSYVYSDEEDAYKLGFNTENNYTQISRWIKIQDAEGNYVSKPTFVIPPKNDEKGTTGELEIHYRVITPESIPAGGQYAVIFAHTLTSVVSANGIKTEASPGIVIYGRSTEGETKISAGISNLEIKQTDETQENGGNLINASAKVKNDGNVDFTASGVLKVDGILSGAHYETPSNTGKVSVIPDTELVVSDKWDETPDFGIFRVTWTVSAGEATETVEKTIILIPVYMILIMIMLLTFIVVWIIMMLRKRKERRTRLAV